MHFETIYMVGKSIPNTNISGDKYAKTVDELTFTDDGMFQAVMHDPTICAELVERLLHIHVKQINYPKLEKQIAPFYTSKGIRLDVYLKDEDKVIDIEIQNTLRMLLANVHVTILQ